LFFHGTYGVGKTSLAIELFGYAAQDQRLARGYLWGRLPDADPERALEWLAQYFPGNDVSRARGLNAKVEAFRRLLAGSPGILIAVDDIRSAPVARSILDASGSCAVLMNGHRPLGLGEAALEVEIPPLEPEDAEALFMNLAKMNASASQRRVIRKICSRMGRLPLGIKLAALKCAEGESLATLWDRLEAAPQLLADEPVRILFEANFQELKAAPVAQRLLVRIAVFPALEAPLDALRADEDDAEFFQAKDKLIALGLIGAAGPDRLTQHPLFAPLSISAAAVTLVKRERRRIADWITLYLREIPRTLRLSGASRTISWAFLISAHVAGIGTAL
jgi:hypothetical protein